MTTRRTLLLVVLCCLTRAVPAADARATLTINPAPLAGALLNPGKGWVLYGMAEWQDAKALSVAGLGYHRFSWTEIEPSEGRYDWDRIDRALAGWDRIGKQFAFGVMCANSHSADPYVTPKWVFDAGAHVRLLDMQKLANPYAGTPGVKAVPDFADAVFLAKLEDFLVALGKRYDGDPRIAFIDIRSYGNWGEGHLYPFGGRELTSDEFRHHIQLHLDAFPQTRLCISAANGAHTAVYDWAASRGAAVRRDGICGNSDGSEVLRAFGHAPGVFEFYGTYTWMKDKGWWDGRTVEGGGHRLVDCVETGKPSYIGLSQGGTECLAFLAAERPLIDRLTNRMGYHVALTRAVVPASLASGVGAVLELTWRNDGVAPIYIPSAVAVALLDAAGTPVEVVWPQESHPAAWLPDSDSVESVSVSFSTAAPGPYRLAVGIVAKRLALRPIVALATVGRTTQGWYPLADVVVHGH